MKLDHAISIASVIALVTWAASNWFGALFAFVGSFAVLFVIWFLWHLLAPQPRADRAPYPVASTVALVISAMMRRSSKH